MKNKNHQAGMTLIEIMIALLIGAFLIGGVLEIFINSRQTYRMQENLSRLQENGRFALDFLAHDIRMAGYRECLTFTVPTPITGTNDTGLDASDTITMQLSTSACGVPVTATAFSTIIYSVQLGAGGQPALFIKNDAAAAQELVEGIENLQILYGVYISPTNFYYVSADQVTTANWPNVVSIRISMLGVTLDDNLTAQPVDYHYPFPTGPAITPADRKIRRVFNATIAVRNPLP
jgi:type IV pilus assembly protein PilW